MVIKWYGVRDEDGLWLDYRSCHKRQDYLWTRCVYQARVYQQVSSLIRFLCTMADNNAFLPENLEICEIVFIDNVPEVKHLMNIDFPDCQILGEVLKPDA